MMPDRHQHVKRLFLAASELSPEEREAFLASACGSDVELRQEIDDLLFHHRPTTFLGQPQQSTAAGQPGPQATRRTPYTDPLTAGTIIADRYRIVSLLGRGGMGEVYRADDLELGQPVALKFLSPELVEHPTAWEALRNEVRLARQVTHPNVVRIHDLLNVDDQLLVSMEYVAGEDLASLLRRVGHLPVEKLNVVARELAEGLAAAHRVGILHRDLKPSNVMLDDRGDVRILDFGIASATNDATDLKRPAGTPGYLAPELTNGHAPTVQSDLYAWGLVVFAAATGESEPERATATGPVAPTMSLAPRATIGERDGELDRVVAQCLESNPQLRPASAEEIVARLSQRDPLTDALAAGRLPSPEVVAAAHALGLSRPQRHGLLGVGVVLLVIVLLMADQSLFLPRCGLIKSPAVLADVSRKLLEHLGHPTRHQPSLSGIVLDDEAYEYLRTVGDPEQVWDDVKEGHWPVVFYWYRSGDPRLPRGAPLGEPAQARLPPIGPDAAAVRLDGHGRLLTFAVNLEALADHPAKTKTADWDKLFALAGLERRAFVEQPSATANEQTDKSSEPQFIIWRGPHPASEREDLIVHGASIGGQVVLFDLRQPWERAGVGLAEPPANHWAVQAVALRTSVWLVTFLCGVGLAWLNMARGFGDWRGARRLVAVVAALMVIEWLIGGQHTFFAAEEVSATFSVLCFVVLAATAVGVLYLSVEPYARRYWPRMLTGWSRLFQGRWRDNAVGKEVLIGAVAGLLWVTLLQLDSLVPTWCGMLPARLKLPELGYDLADFYALEYKGQVIVRAMVVALASSLLLMFLLLLVHLCCKLPWLSKLVFVILATLLFTTRSHLDSHIPGLAYALIYLCAALLVTRIGLLSMVIAWFVLVSVLNSPLTLDGHLWFASTASATIASLVAVLLWGWYAAYVSTRHGTRNA